jgi:hypothetical protein
LLLNINSEYPEELDQKSIEKRDGRSAQSRTPLTTSNTSKPRNSASLDESIFSHSFGFEYRSQNSPGTFAQSMLSDPWIQAVWPPVLLAVFHDVLKQDLKGGTSCPKLWRYREVFVLRGNQPWKLGREESNNIEFEENFTLSTLIICFFRWIKTRGSTGLHSSCKETFESSSSVNDNRRREGGVGAIRNI